MQLQLFALRPFSYGGHFFARGRQIVTDHGGLALALIGSRKAAPADEATAARLGLLEAPTPQRAAASPWGSSRRLWTR